MGRTRGFEVAEAVAQARDVFARNGYLGTSVDDLLTALGIPRSSLYHAFGSKRGLFLAALERPASEPDLDLLLVALMDLCRDEAEIRELVVERLRALDDPALVLGRRMLDRADVPGQGEGRTGR